MFPSMTDDKADKHRDAMLVWALKTPPIPRAQLQEDMRRAREERRSEAKPTPALHGVESPATKP